MKNTGQRFKENQRTIVFLFCGGITLMGVGFYCIVKCMAMIEGRTGMVLSDFLHPLLPPPIDLSNWIFTATYSATFITIYHIIRQGLYYSAVVFLAYSMLFFLRCASIVAIPLDPPPGMIPLDDPFIRFFNPENFVYSKDLFFSGHTATMFSLYFFAKDKRLKSFLFVLALFVVTAISLQRVHYTIDIFGGVVAAYATFMLAQVLEKKLWHICHEPVVRKVAVKSAVHASKEELANFRS